ncbi:MAG: hypothetical protein UV57_C0011G0024 [Parcubacteria group bacterium GW2011_GWD2_43_10]|uniref:Type II secretion system protein GspG C-terminal domain-containing protein n=2 Tax=Candidatus Vebleniibacteriota TaxID=1817921 RepID=A0A1G2Q0Z1_9BACT|nr:MAG: hypothetical protein UV47_C0023G0002 [Parcubacteria group bacterium GW2011_GWA2_42_80]KKS83568.1 MAG: hypothetical protein UV57_C0011G0024 [Parcubacteria group bacterium GW2011_GWD2_43_10]OHA54244.1 MAG: hypothetical protein A2226_00850 [Candidatus Veblenbacteria bacterium RIFOXYA2_FULL_43_9]OHA56644.1 MAG: hypothetical protein A2441_02455 [Candidatus Veblenbacteria bacterium RIFOXYC2_FULL_42_11]HBT92151.1 hypothetical protein [Candidatus Veblenbacteria bacterium]
MIKESIRGFTVIEALIVIGVVGALASTVLLATEQSRLKSQEIRIRVDLTQARSAISLLLYDTGKWPNGCEPEKVSNPEVAINTAQSGIVKKPNVGDQGNDCKWTQNDINNWDGPYMDRAVDIWGNSYWFDPYYHPYEKCSEIPAKPIVSAVVSFGRTWRNGVNDYDCDDLFLEVY